MIDKSTFDIKLIGAGNLATNLGKALYGKGYRISQVYSRTAEAATLLAEKIGARPTSSLDEIGGEGHLYIVSLTDTAFEQLLPQITAGKKDKLFVHTAGSIPMDSWKGSADRYGVFYPMQTFSKSREIDFSDIPIFPEASSEADLALLREIGQDLSSSVYEISSEQRRILHLSAVFACNFTNHMYALSARLLEENGIPFNVMLPLIDETARKVHLLLPDEAQTGPAVRYDNNVIDKHLQLLASHPTMRELYEKISKSIHQL